ncbi:MAG: siderophore-interacting protein [Halomonas sp.]|nr:siderophore-interacting protein [Halomonas sp.]
MTYSVVRRCRALAESRVAWQLRRYLINECGLPKRYVIGMGYWCQGEVLG